jgi:hypothetical protein
LAGDINSTNLLVHFKFRKMAYLRRWRKCHAEAAAIALASSSSEDEAPDVQVEERRDTERESTSHSSDNHAVTTDSDSSDNGDVDFGFSDTVESSDSASGMSEREDALLYKMFNFNVCFISGAKYLIRFSQTSLKTILT